MSHPQSGRNETKQTADVSTPFWVPDAMVQLNPLLSGMTVWNDTCSKSVAALNNECLDFLRRRATEDIALPQLVVSCKSPDDIWRVYADFWQRAVDDYRNEFAELARLSSSVASESNSARPQCAAQGGKDKSRQRSRL